MLKKISLVTVLAVLLMLAVPVSATLPLCSGTVLTYSDRCKQGSSNEIDLHWTAQDGAVSYKFCDFQMGCGSAGDKLTVGGPFSPGNYNIVILPIDSQGYYICESNTVSFSIPVNCPPVISPEFPTLFMPLVTIIGLVGIVLFIGQHRKY